MKPTPGPWELSGPNSAWEYYGEHYTIAPPGSWGEIAVIFLSNNPTDLIEQATANAHLIAAAPELLKSLQFMVDAANTEPEMGIFRAHIKQAEEVIAKANAR